MTFKVKAPNRSKTVIYIILKQANIFTYLGCEITYEEANGVTLKLSNFYKL
jgi:hypothetical protein